MKPIDIVIVNWNAGYRLKVCVESVNKYSSNIVSKIIVIDNGSTDGSEQAIENFENVLLIRVGQNLGFGRACNLGATYSDSEFILFLNPDTLLYEHTLVKVFEQMKQESNAHVGICGVRLFDEHNKTSRCVSRFPSVKGFLSHALGLDRFFPSLGHFMAEWDHESTREVDQIIGAFFFVRRNLFFKLNGFDERFFVYFEEVDFSFRAKKWGWTSLYYANASAFHEGGGTSNQIKGKRLFYSLKSRLLYTSKHFNYIYFFTILFITLFIEPIARFCFGTMKLSVSNIKETSKAYMSLIYWLLSNGLSKDTP